MPDQTDDMILSEERVDALKRIMTITSQIIRESTEFEVTAASAWNKAWFELHYSKERKDCA